LSWANVTVEPSTLNPQIARRGLPVKNRP